MFSRTLFPAQVLLFLFLFPVTLLNAAEVQNVKPSQAGNRILFEFDVVGEEPETEITVTVRVGDKTLSSDQLHLEGDFGKVRVARGKRIYWNVLQDFPRGLSGDVSWEIMAGGRIYKDPITGMELVFVKGGCFQMGDTFGDGGADEKPVHDVCVSDFYMGKFEVTQRQWRIVMGTTPSTFKNCGDDCPVEQVSWNDAQEFISTLNQKTGKRFRLPTEAEWEYAARSGGKKEKWAGTSSEGDLGDYAWYGKNSGRQTRPVGQKKPNGLGLYDMSGNVWEWCADWHDANYYQRSPRDNPGGPDRWSLRVSRGGSWAGSARDERATERRSGSSKGRSIEGGFRLVLAPR